MLCDVLLTCCWLTEALELYERKRSDDPGLSKLGDRQAETLPEHRHLRRVRLKELVCDKAVCCALIAVAGGAKARAAGVVADASRNADFPLAGSLP